MRWVNIEVSRRKILLLGQAPLPPELDPHKESRVSAPGIRAWHFGKALHEAGHEVELVSIWGSGQGLPEGQPTSRQIAPGFTLYSLSEAAVASEGALAALESKFEPDGVVAASVWPSYLGALFLSPDVPFWGDMDGSPLAEGQAKAFTTSDDAVLEPYARYERTVLSRIDAISAVSSYQQYAMVGALATHGRLNRHTDGYRFTHVIPPTLDPVVSPPGDQKFLRGTIVPEDAFVVLWSGGFNTWTDIDTLFAGLEGAIAANPYLHFVATGGALGTHDRQTYPRFERLVAASPHRERYHLLGWRPYAGLHNYFLESDVGLILDRWSYEGLLGSRSRLLDWLLYELPTVLTMTAQLTEELVRDGLAFSFPHRDGAALAQMLTALAAQPEQLQAARRRAHDYAVERFAYGVACRPMLEWAASPSHAPDFGKPRPDFASANPDLERHLLSYQSQLEAKNAQIAALESWARHMETRLKATPDGWRGLAKKVATRLGLV